MPPDPPVPLAAHWVAGTKTLTVVYDQALTPGALSAAQLTCRAANMSYNQPSPGTIAGDTVTAVMANPNLDLGPDLCSYAAAPADVVSLKGIPGAPFAGFPIT